jgi:hypothetical protein
VHVDAIAEEISSRGRGALGVRAHRGSRGKGYCVRTGSQGAAAPALGDATRQRGQGGLELTCKPKTRGVTFSRNDDSAYR